METVKRTLYYSIILFIVPMMAFESCKKEEEPEIVVEEPAPVDKSELLVDRWWNLAGLYMGDVQQPIVNTVEVRFLNLGIYNYRTNGGNYDETWEWADNQTKIIIASGTEFEEVWDVIELRNNQLNIKRGLGVDSEQRIFVPQ